VIHLSPHGDQIKTVCAYFGVVVAFVAFIVVVAMLEQAWARWNLRRYKK